MLEAKPTVEVVVSFQEAHTVMFYLRLPGAAIISRMRCMLNFMPS
jgi:hypothetical protein